MVANGNGFKFGGAGGVGIEGNCGCGGGAAAVAAPGEKSGSALGGCGKGDWGVGVVGFDAVVAAVYDVVKAGDGAVAGFGDVEDVEVEAGAVYAEVEVGVLGAVF
ncbi:MAG: hypothetical protein SVR94_05140 [Pseudomonadota bacterium]|nr:hypothetical protein [Pseudomonadota bacterium]